MFYVTNFHNYSFVAIHIALLRLSPSYICGTQKKLGNDLLAEIREIECRIWGRHCISWCLRRVREKKVSGKSTVLSHIKQQKCYKSYKNDGHQILV